MKSWGTFRSIIMVAVVLCTLFMAALQGDIVGGLGLGLGPATRVWFSGFQPGSSESGLSSSSQNQADDTFPRRQHGDVSYVSIATEDLKLPLSSFMVSLCSAEPVHCPINGKVLHPVLTDYWMYISITPSPRVWNPYDHHFFSFFIV